MPSSRRPEERRRSGRSEPVRLSGSRVCALAGASPSLSTSRDPPVWGGCGVFIVVCTGVQALRTSTASSPMAEEKRFIAVRIPEHERLETPCSGLRSLTSPRTECVLGAVRSITTAQNLRLAAGTSRATHFFTDAVADSTDGGGACAVIILAAGGDGGNFGVGVGLGLGLGVGGDWLRRLRSWLLCSCWRSRKNICSSRHHHDLRIRLDCLEHEDGCHTAKIGCEGDGVLRKTIHCGKFSSY